MPVITEEQLKHHNATLVSLEMLRLQWQKLWRELGDNYLPQRYRWLMQAKEYYANRARRQYIINNTGTRAARTLTAGMMNGVTSPSRPWFKLRVPGVNLDEHRSLAVWLEEVERRMLRIMAESNFYNSMATMYLDLVVFGTAANLIYEDFESVIRCYNPPLGEYFIDQDDRGLVNTFARKFNISINNYISKWPNEQYWSDRVKNAVTQGGAALHQDIEISHYVGKNTKNIALPRFPFYELYWESKRQQTNTAPQVLHKGGFYELPGIFARWEVSGTDAYGVSPGMDAIGDNIELQHLHRNKAELLEKMHKPSLLVDVQLQNEPLALMPNGHTYVPNLNNTSGAKPIHTVNPDFSQLAMDIQLIEQRIKDTFFNFLFTGISDLPTVRSATEVDAREGEKLILLGGVLERLESEALDPAIKRIFAIGTRANLLPPKPPEYAEVPLEIQYVSILSVAQRAVGTAPAERWLGLVGNVLEVNPEAGDLTDYDKLLTNYARDIGLRESELRSSEEVEERRGLREQQQQMEQMAAAAPPLTQGAKNLSETEVGGGANALEQLLGGGA